VQVSEPTGTEFLKLVACERCEYKSERPSGDHSARTQARVCASHAGGSSRRLASSIVAVVDEGDHTRRRPRREEIRRGLRQSPVRGARDTNDVIREAGNRLEHGHERGPRSERGVHGEWPPASLFSERVRAWHPFREVRAEHREHHQRMRRGDHGAHRRAAGSQTWKSVSRSGCHSVEVATPPRRRTYVNVSTTAGRHTASVRYLPGGSRGREAREDDVTRGEALKRRDRHARARSEKHPCDDEPTDVLGYRPLASPAQ
jgi:hypothetical protein